MNTDPKPIIQEVKLKGNQLLDKVREIIDEGNARRIIVKNDDRTLFEIPMMAGVGGAAAALYLAPVLAGIGAIAALVTDVSIVVERDADKDGVAESSTHVFGKKGDAKGDASHGDSHASAAGGKTMGSEPKA